jgi:hypothetical protein
MNQLFSQRFFYGFGFMLSYLRKQMEVNGQPHVTVPILPGKQPLATI